MAEALGKLIDWLKSPRQCAPVFVAALTVLLLPAGLLQSNGLEIVVHYRGAVLLLAILSGAVLITEGLYHLWRLEKEKREARASRQQAIEYLESLSPGEKGLLRKFFAERTDTQYLSTSDGIAGGLIAKGLIYRSSNTGHHSMIGPIFAHNLQPWVREYVDAHPEVLEGAERPSPPPSPFSRRRLSEWMMG